MSERVRMFRLKLARLVVYLGGRLLPKHESGMLSFIYAKGAGDAMKMMTIGNVFDPEAHTQLGELLVIAGQLDSKQRLEVCRNAVALLVLGDKLNTASYPVHEHEFDKRPTIN